MYEYNNINKYISHFIANISAKKMFAHILCDKDLN